MKRTTSTIIIGLLMVMEMIIQVPLVMADAYADAITNGAKCYEAAGEDLTAKLACEMDILNQTLSANLEKCGDDTACKDEAKKKTAELINIHQSEYCQNKYGTSCAEYAQKARNASGQGFKLPLNFLTLTTKDSKGNKVTQGQSIFANKDYPVEKYGVLLGTSLRIIDILVYVIGSLALLTLIVAGIMMIANHGDEGWVTKGKGMMLYSILGVIFALLSFIFVNIVTSLLS